MLAARRAGRAGSPPRVAPRQSAGRRARSPYTPLHHLLLAAAGRAAGDDLGQPLRRADRLRQRRGAATRLRGIADLFVLHDRDIVTRCDDSVARVIAGRPVVLRRARGYVPRPIAAGDAVRRAGARLRRAAEEHLLLSAAATRRASARTSAISTASSVYRRLRGVDRAAGAVPRRHAGDRRARPASRLPVDALRARRGRRDVTIGVQHHHAHVASAMAEHGLDGPGDRRRLRRHRLRHRRHRVGRRAADRRLRRVRARWRRSARCRSPAATRPSASRGASRSRCVDDAFEGEAPLDGFPLFRRMPPRRRRRRACA